MFAWQGLLIQLVVADYVHRLTLSQKFRFLALRAFAQDAIAKLDH